MTIQEALATYTHRQHGWADNIERLPVWQAAEFNRQSTATNHR